VKLIERLRCGIKHEQQCIECGKAFETARIDAVFCGRACQMRAWRAAKMLEGTHGWVIDRFGRTQFGRFADAAH
jgi:hypothetical protein